MLKRGLPVYAHMQTNKKQFKNNNEIISNNFKIITSRKKSQISKTISRAHDRCLEKTNKNIKI